MRFQPCENNCGQQRAAYAKGYHAHICAHCRQSMEGKAARSAVAELRRVWRGRESTVGKGEHG